MTGRTTARTVTARTVTGRWRAVGVVLAVMLTAVGTAGCNPENCTGHYEPRAVSRPYYTVGADGHLHFAGYRPGTDYVCVPGPGPRTTTRTAPRTARVTRTGHRTERAERTGPVR